MTWKISRKNDWAPRRSHCHDDQHSHYFSSGQQKMPTHHCTNSPNNIKQLIRKCFMHRKIAAICLCGMQNEAQNYLFVSFAPNDKRRQRMPETTCSLSLFALDNSGHTGPAIFSQPNRFHAGTNRDKEIRFICILSSWLPSRPETRTKHFTDFWAAQFVYTDHCVISIAPAVAALIQSHSFFCHILCEQ